MVLPATLHKQNRLLTLNIHAEAPIQEPVQGYEMHPLFLDPENGTWVLYARFPPGTKLPTHFHTGTVHFFTTRGEWHYVEHPDDRQTAGSYLYEPAGSVHQFCVPEDASEPAEGCCQSNANPSPAACGVGAVIRSEAGAIRRGRRFSSI